MDAVRELIQNIGLERGHFDLLIFGVIIVGGMWAVKRLYTDITGPVLDFHQDEQGEE